MFERMSGVCVALVLGLAASAAQGRRVLMVLTGADPTTYPSVVDFRDVPIGIEVAKLATVPS